MTSPPSRSMASTLRADVRRNSSSRPWTASMRAAKYRASRLVWRVSSAGRRRPAAQAGGAGQAPTPEERGGGGRGGGGEEPPRAARRGGGGEPVDQPAGLLVPFQPG